MKKILTIAGSDSGAGAGIQGDLKVFAAHGIYGTSAITALTAQNTLEVREIFSIPSSFIAAQIRAVMDDIGANAWKTGMLHQAEHIEIIAELKRHYALPLLIVDPIMISSSGRPLLEEKAINTLIDHLFPQTTVLTPNCHEAAALIQAPVRTLEEMKRAARLIRAMGPQAVIIKGGHLPENSDVIDLLFDGQTFLEIRSQRLISSNTHGTGGAFASSLASWLVQGKSLAEAFQNAHHYVHAALKEAQHFNIGGGKGPLQHFPF